MLNRLITKIGRRAVAAAIAVLAGMTAAQAQPQYIEEGLIKRYNLPNVTEESKDEAYDRPASSLVGTWLRIDQEQAYKFDSNGIVTWSYPYRRVEGITVMLTYQWTWKKKGDHLTLTPIAGKKTVFKIDPTQQDEYNALSNRRRNIITETIVSLSESARALPAVTIDIEMLTDNILVLNDDYYIKNTSVDKFIQQAQSADETNVTREHRNSEKDEIITYNRKPDDDKVYTAVEQMPQFPGGDAEMMRYLAEHIKYPTAAMENNIQGRVVVQFVVQKDGSIGEVKVAHSRDPDLDREAIRVVKSFPKFIPGKMNGEPVDVWYTTPITFKLTGI